MSVFEKLPFKGLAEKALGGAGTKVPLVGKLISFANQIVSGVAALVLVIIIAGAAGSCGGGGGTPKNINQLLTACEKVDNISLLVIEEIVKKTSPNDYAKAIIKQCFDNLIRRDNFLWIYYKEGIMKHSSAEQRNELDKQFKAAASKAPPAPESDFSYSLNSEKNGIILEKYTGENLFLVIPSKVEGYPVVQIGKYTSTIPSDALFANAYFVIIPEGVKIIGNGAFKEVLHAVFPSTLEKIGEFAFSGKDVFDNISMTILDLSGTSLIEIGNIAFLGMHELKIVKLPNTLEIIKSAAFSNNSVLTDINLPANIKRIEHGAFHNCKELNNIIIPDSITQIQFPRYSYDDAAFEGCGKLPIKTRQRLQELGYKDEF